MGALLPERRAHGRGRSRQGGTTGFLLGDVALEATIMYLYEAGWVLLPWHYPC